MNPSLLVAECLATPWALMPERLQALASIATRWSVGNAADPDTLKQIEIDRVSREIRRASSAAPSPGGIAVLPLYGVITQRGNMVDAVSGPGMTSTQQFAAALRELVADKSVSQILIDIDSPGGSVYGVCELADEIMAARAQKPVVAIANSLAASAAYWIGCAASEFYVKRISEAVAFAETYTARSEALEGLVVAVTPNQVVLEQVGRLAWHTTPTQVILVGAGPERYLSDPPCNDCGLLGLDHAHRDIGLASQEVAHRIAGYQFHLHIGQ